MCNEIQRQKLVNYFWDNTRTTGGMEKVHTIIKIGTNIQEIGSTVPEQAKVFSSGRMATNTR
jgi:hypothetical protein